MKKIFSGLFCCLLLTVLASAAGIEIKKEAPTQIILGNNLTIAIELQNTGIESQNITITEMYGNAIPVTPEPIIPIIRKDIIAAQPPYFQWRINLGPNEKKIIKYTVIPQNLGVFSIAPTAAISDNGTYYSKELSVLVKCEGGTACKTNIGENYFTCPENCPSGGKDNSCDGLLDGKCDPDCNISQDFDCHCGNNICEQKYLENYKNCPKDCPSGSKDGFCDGITDGKCDPDCLISQDTDCKIPFVPKNEGSDNYGLFLIVAVIVLIIVFVIGAKIMKKI